MGVLSFIKHVLTHVKSNALINMLEPSTVVRRMLLLYPVISMQPRLVINPVDRRGRLRFSTEANNTYTCG